MRPGYQQSLAVAAVVVLLAMLDSVNGYCSQGSDWVEYEGHCYLRTWANNVNWFRAELSCRQHGAHLVSIESARANDFLLRLVQCRPYWIGMVNTDPAHRPYINGYEWWDRTPRNYTNLSPQNSNYQDCVYSNSDGKWYNAYCQNYFNYICKAPASRAGSVEAAAHVLMPAIQSVRKQPEAEAVWYTTGDYYTTGGYETTEIETTTEVPGTTERPRSTTKAPPKCQSGWQLLDNNCYYVSPDTANYFNAQMSCQSMGSNVASVLTPREHALVTIAVGCTMQAWIGLEKAKPCFKQPNKDHCWVWMDRSPVNYFEWNAGQSLNRNDAECVILNGQWSVVNCYNTYRYICKKAAY